MNINTSAIFDHLNFRVFFLAIKNFQKFTTVYVLLRSSNRGIEAIIEKLLSYFAIDIQYLDFSATETYRKHTELADEMTSIFLSANDHVLLEDDYFRMALGEMFYSRVYRLATLLTYIRNDPNLSKIKNIYLAGNHLWRNLEKISLLSGVKFYRTLSRCIRKEMVSTGCFKRKM